MRQKEAARDGHRRAGQAGVVRAAWEMNGPAIHLAGADLSTVAHELFFFVHLKVGGVLTSS